VLSTAILVVEDDQEIRDFLALVLEAEGYAVRTAHNGAMALELIRQQTPDLILLDMRMPVMDGWAFVQAYRSQPGPHAPIIVQTAARDAEQTAREVQADAFLGKPFNLDDLLAVVRTTLR
jgi:two-component system, chemotaxis family, chemotaxis protein CheY